MKEDVKRFWINVIKSIGESQNNRVSRHGMYQARQKTKKNNNIDDNDLRKKETTAIKNKALSRRIGTGIAVVGILFTLAVPVSALSLEDSFSSGTYINTLWSDGLGNYKLSKSCWAKTSGYSGYHYVRAMVGQNGSWADTGRKYSYGNITATATTKAIETQSALVFPRGYAYYGY